MRATTSVATIIHKSARDRLLSLQHGQGGLPRGICPVQSPLIVTVMTVFALPMLTLSLTLLCVGQTQFTTTVTTVQSHLQFGAHPHSQPLFLFKRGHSPRRRRTRAPSLIAPTRMIQHLVRLGRGRSLAVPVLTSQLLRSKGLISHRRLLRTFLLTECMRQQHTAVTLQFSN